MKIPIPTIDDFPSDRANCGNCTRKGGVCARSKSKQRHNGLLMGYAGEVTGIIYCCPSYTGPYQK